MGILNEKMDEKVKLWTENQEIDNQFNEVREQVEQIYFGFSQDEPNLDFQ